MGNDCSVHCCCCWCYGAERRPGDYNRVSNEPDEEELTSLDDEKNKTIDTVVMSASSKNETTTETEGEDDACSIEDPAYYLVYHTIPDETNESSGGPLDKTRRRYESAIDGMHRMGDTKRQLIYEYEAFKSRYFNIEHYMTAEALAAEARQCANVARKKTLYREALLHTNDAEKKATLKKEYNDFYRSLNK